jgi:S-(hydroxymethyl)mycothiol dehydrogenase
VGQGLRRHAHLNASSGDVVQGLRELTGGFGPDVVIDAVGRPET